MENLDLVRAAFDSFSRQDRDFADKILHPSFEVVSPLAEARGHAYQGLDGARQWFDDIEENFARFEIELDELREVREGRVLGLGRVQVSGRASGLEYEQPFGCVIDIEDDRLRTVWVFFDHEAARAAAESV